MSKKLLEIQNLITSFSSDDGYLRAVDEVSLTIEKGKTLGLVGESGCGKSVTAMSIVQLLPQPAGRIIAGKIIFNGRHLTDMPNAALRKIRGNDIGVIFQEPMTALNPTQRIGKQLSEVFLLHNKMSKKQAWDASLEMLKKVRIPAPELRMGDYPHQLSGGMRQRVVIALALANKPELLIADEPTTALDVTVQAQILQLIKDLQNEMGMAVLLITHDLGVIAETCDEVAVMYAGRIVERAPVNQIFHHPRHAYTKGLLESMPKLNTPPKSILPIIPNMVAAIKDYTSGCRFCQRMQRPNQSSKRPEFKEITPHHWVEMCPLCVQ